VRIGGGATWGQVAAALAPYGLAISAGDTKSVGVGGLTLGGGIGWKVRKYGLALDNVVAAEVVLADGTVVEASAQEHPDLFWALRGGGGNFGIVTSFVFAAHPTTDVFFGAIAFPAAQAARVLPGWAEHMRFAPDALTSVVNLANPAAGGRDAPIEVVVVFDGDDPDAAAEAIDPIRRLGTAVADDVAPTPYADTLADGATPPPGLQVVTRNAFVEAASVPAVLEVVIDAVAAGQPPVIGLRSVGGAVASVPADATAYAYRHAELLIATVTAGPPAVVEATVPALDALWGRLAAHVDGAYANFLTSATAADVAAIYPAATFARLAAVKREYDPGNLFARNHNVPPSTRPSAVEPDPALRYGRPRAVHQASEERASSPVG
jgi:FAD/FMN-containing dehydrogenase